MLVEPSRFLRSPRVAARVDLLEMATGVLLVGFMWSHMGLLSTMLVGPETMNALAAFLEETYMAQVGVVGIAALIVLHMIAAGRKLPSRVLELRTLMSLRGKLRHGDTNLWVVQVVTGVAVGIFAAIHLWEIGTTFPIEAAKSAARVAGTGADGGAAYGWLYAPAILLVELHVGIGLYRVLVKWTGLSRRGLIWMKWGVTGVFLALGYWILSTFWTHGAGAGG